MINRRNILLGFAGLTVTSAADASTTPAKIPAKTPAKTAKTGKVVKPAKAAKKKAPPPPRLIISVNKVSQKMTVTLDGDQLYSWPISTGAKGYDTPSGTFRPFRMEKEHFSKEWDDAPMPYSIFFTGEGHALHGSYHVKSLGRRASHGCVRILPENAAKLFDLVGKTGMANTRVVIKGGFFDGGFDDGEGQPRKKRRSLFDWGNNS